MILYFSNGTNAILIDQPSTTIIDGQIRPNLRLANFAEMPVAMRASVNVSRTYNTNPRSNDSEHTGKEKPPSPSGHIFLSVQIVAGALIFTGGFYGFLYSFNKSGTIHPDTGTFYVFLGISCALIGSAIRINTLP